MQKKSPDRYHHGNLKAALIQTGLEILVSEGTEALSLRAVARRAGVSHAAPYRHFTDKNALIVAIAEEGFTSLDKALTGALESCALNDAAQQFKSLGSAYVEFARQNRQYMKVMFGSFISDYGQYPDLEKKVVGGMVLLEMTLRKGQEQGAIKKTDLRVMALSCWSIVHGVSMLIAEGRSEISDMNDEQLKAFVLAMLDNLLQGIKA